MRVSIVNTLPVPSGNASVNRFLGYGKALVKCGVLVDVLSSASFDDNEIDGMCAISCGRGRSMAGTLISIIHKLLTGEYNAVILVSNSLLLIYPVWFICRLKKMKFLQEKSEFPFVLMKQGFFRSLFAFFYVNTTYRLFDGLIVMTKPLMDYFRKKVRKKSLIIELPMTVDTDRFDIERKESEFGDYVAYCGNMAGNKDGVLNLIASFCLASPKIPDVKLLLIGGASNRGDWERILTAVREADNDHIILYGEATRDQIPPLLNNAKALALARPSSLQSTGGFPTKLGEYLATGNPVIVTAVGDIPQYLNNSNSFIVPPDDNQAFADAMINVFSDYDNAAEIGLAGKKLSQTVFSSRVQSERLFEYLKTICE